MVAPTGKQFPFHMYTKTGKPREYSSPPSLESVSIEINDPFNLSNIEISMGPDGGISITGKKSAEEELNQKLNSIWERVYDSYESLSNQSNTQSEIAKLEKTGAIYTGVFTGIAIFNGFFQGITKTVAELSGWPVSTSLGILATLGCFALVCGPLIASYSRERRAFKKYSSRLRRNQKAILLEFRDDPILGTANGDIHLLDIAFRFLELRTGNRIELPNIVKDLNSALDGSLHRVGWFVGRKRKPRMVGKDFIDARGELLNSVLIAANAPCIETLSDVAHGIRRLEDLALEYERKKPGRVRALFQRVFSLS